MESEVELSDFISPEIGKFQVVCEITNNCRIVTNRFTSPYPGLTHIHVRGLTIDDTLLSNLAKSSHMFPSLVGLTFELTRFSLMGKLPQLFTSTWPELTHLSLKSCFLNEADIGSLRRHGAVLPKLNSLEFYLGEGTDILFDQNLNESGELRDNYQYVERQSDTPLFSLFGTTWTNLTRLWFFDMNKMEYRAIVSLLDSKSFPNLIELGIVMWSYAEKQKMSEKIRGQRISKGRKYFSAAKGKIPERLPSINISSVTDLTLHRLVCTVFHLYWMTKSNFLTQLHKLDISHSSGMTGTLSILLCHSFPSLHTLILSDCGLNSQDFISLAHASVKGRLSELKHLDISKNDEALTSCTQLFCSGAQWQKLTELICDQLVPNSEAFVCVLQHVESNCLNSLQKLTVSLDKTCFDRMYEVVFQSLTEFYIQTPQIGFVKILNGIAGAVEKGLFPVLGTVNLTLRHDETDSEAQENTQQEMLALVKRFQENGIPDELTNKVIHSVGNLIMHINSNTNIDGNLPVHALCYDSMIASMLKTLQGHITASQQKLIQSGLVEFLEKISFSRLSPSHFKETSIPFMEEAIRQLPSLKCALRQKGVTVVICAPLKQWDPDITLSTLSKMTSMQKNNQLPGQ